MKKHICDNCGKKYEKSDCVNFCSDDCWDSFIAKCERDNLPTSIYPFGPLI